MGFCSLTSCRDSRLRTGDQCSVLFEKMWLTHKFVTCSDFMFGSSGNEKPCCEKFGTWTGFQVHCFYFQIFYSSGSYLWLSKTDWNAQQAWTFAASAEVIAGVTSIGVTWPSVALSRNSEKYLLTVPLIFSFTFLIPSHHYSSLSSSLHLLKRYNMSSESELIFNFESKTFSINIHSLPSILNQ